MFRLRKKWEVRKKNRAEAQESSVDAPNKNQKKKNAPLLLVLYDFYSKVVSPVGFLNLPLPKRQNRNRWSNYYLQSSTRELEWPQTLSFTSSYSILLFDKIHWPNISKQHVTPKFKIWTSYTKDYTTISCADRRRLSLRCHIGKWVIWSSGPIAGRNT
jgi:hypothetical protein